jgi:hypothetical protein
MQDSLHMFALLEVDHANLPSGMAGLIALIQVRRVHETDAIAF